MSDLLFTTSTLSIMHFVYPQKFCISIVFNFSWDLQSSQEKLKTMLMQNFWGQTKCIMDNVEVAECAFMAECLTPTHCLYKKELFLSLLLYICSRVKPVLQEGRKILVISYPALTRLVEVFTRLLGFSLTLASPCLRR